jgi:pSer/pThr/pTyr-binding forkhead associated (FHA) protein
MTANADQLRLSLRFLSGKNQGSEYVLADPSEIIVGRSGEADLILVEGMVSRAHARLELREGALVLHDMGSTNGTFVNGEKVTGSRRLREGDRVLIGTTILKVVFSESPLGTKPPPPKSSALDDIQTNEANSMAGQLAEVSVPELIEMFGSARQKLVLEVDGGDGPAFITIAEGKVLDCSITKLTDAPALKCVLRVLGYEKGTFTVRTFEQPDPARLDVPVPELLVDGLFKLDETNVLRQRLPDGEESLVLARPLTPALSALEERDLDLLQLAYNAGSVEEVMDLSAETDLEAAKRLLNLLDGGYLRKA